MAQTCCHQKRQQFDLVHSITMAQQFPWWFQKLLLHYLPSYVVRLLEDPWIVGVIIGAFFVIKFFTVSYITYKLMKERKLRKKIEVDHAKLLENYEKLKITTTEQQTAMLTMMSNKMASIEPHKDQQQSHP